MKNKSTFLLFFLLPLVNLLSAQERDSTKSMTFISGSASVTQNGISLIPSFSLEKPAAIFNISLAKGRFSFDPEVTFSLQGKPWYALFWFRYQLVNGDKFRMKAGTHLGLNYVSTVLPINRNPNDVIITERYLVGELAPTYSITKNLSVGLYYLHARGFDIGTSKATHFFTINGNFSNIPFGGKLFMSITPQVYYLSLYGDEGYYFTSEFTLARSDWPVVLRSTINKVIKTDIAASKDFLWNLTLTYSFGKRKLI